MDVEREIYRQAAKTLAIEVILQNLFRDLALTEPYWKVRLAAALDASSIHLENAAITLGRTAHPDYLTEALKTCEEIRSVVMGQKS